MGVELKFSIKYKQQLTNQYVAGPSQQFACRQQKQGTFKYSTQAITRVKIYDSELLKNLLSLFYPLSWRFEVDLILHKYFRVNLITMHLLKRKLSSLLHPID